MEIDHESAQVECDCDFASIKIRVEDFVLAVGGLAPLPWSVQRKVLDSRLDDAVQISSSGFNVFARGDNLKKRLIQELSVSHGILIVPAREEQLLTEAPGKRIDTFTFTDALIAVGVSELFVYAFGFKSVHTRFLAYLGTLADGAQAVDNKYDIGVSVLEPTVPLFSTEDVIVDGRRVNYRSRVQKYPLFKHMGAGSGGLEMQLELEPNVLHKAKVYQKWTHGLKAIVANWKVPKTGIAARNLWPKYKSIIACFESEFQGLLGGYRLEVTVEGTTFAAVRERYSYCLCIQWFEGKGVVVTHRLAPADILSNCTLALEVAKELGLFNRNNGIGLEERERVPLADLLNLIGWSYGGADNRLVKQTGFRDIPWRCWMRILRPAVRAPTPPDIYDLNEMAENLAYKLLNDGTTYSLMEMEGQACEIQWVGDRTNREHEFFTRMGTAVRDAGVHNWRTRFIMEIPPRYVRYNLNIPDWEQNLIDMLEEQRRSLNAGRADRDNARPEHIILPNATSAESMRLEETVSVNNPTPNEASEGITEQTALNPGHNENEPAAATEIRSSAGTQVARQPDARLDLIRDHGITWITGSVPRNIVEAIPRAVALTARYRIRRPPRVNTSPFEDLIMLEHVFQRCLVHNDPSTVGAEPFWEEALAVHGIPLHYKSADSMKTRWNNHLKRRYEATGGYRDRRRAQRNAETELEILGQR